ncbi:type II toxin-antitoxin system VapC family toxin [Kribbella solani]|uniref:type II toxin-antitoxin system VapC family toxin n=1 Tax=Kribbella solani TaxID=236067 RepID=UPI0029A021D7|nr:type II toxin-antitoxin system VapC family toxin [Kribbella solani]MDX3005782.1 type II toxin-antitoxin system VapC family toxin [Kribbella solani]
MIVFDTNVASELMKAAPDSSVTSWYATYGSMGLYTTAITVAEIRYGIARLPSGRRRTVLSEAAGEIFAEFADSILPFDAAAAGVYPEVVIGRERAGLPIDEADAQIAAICRLTDAVLATRNTKDFVGTGLELVNPWE